MRCLSPSGLCWAKKTCIFILGTNGCRRALTWSQSCEVSLDPPGLGSEGWGWAAGAAHHPWSGSEEPK